VLITAVGARLALAGLIAIGFGLYMALVGIFAPKDARYFLSHLTWVR